MVKEVNESGDSMWDFLFSQAVAIELFKIIVTALFGFISFKIFQMYRNKKDNSRLYIQIIELEREIVKNQELLRKIIDYHSKYYLLDSLFRGENTEGLYELYGLVNSLKLYVNQDIVYGKGEPDVEVAYTEKPLEIIRHLNCERNQIEADGEQYRSHLESIDADIERYECKSIYNLLLDIENRAKALDMKDHELHDPIEYLIVNIEKFNSLKGTQKRKNLDEFCSHLIDKSNIFLDSLKLFNDYEDVSRMIHNDNEKAYEKFEFKVWQQQDLILLGVYSTEDYLALEEYYHKNRIIEISNWEIEKAEKMYREMQYIYEIRILKIKDMLKKTLDKTNWIFGNI
ncbi:hypothetical protein [Natranaerobius trueperi]|uniref:Uncharacterized protein n=1 Tax=Natranaerobius trueperi TaxID=759412 RepID=A0A226BWF2_9FIRM|nr:hypothetical protein [Natranaerobius trueperi]OWZ83368.1 hypothetical protein CDO51_09110 [Natranaerobius trueperi]